MSPQLRRITAAALFLVVAGALRAPIEQRMTEHLQAEGMLRAPLEISTQKKLGQGFWAVSLGGLRTLVASILSLRAQTFFDDKYWDGVAEAYETIVQLAPESPFYWDTGYWHMGINAVSYYRNNYEDLPPARARALQHTWLVRATRFLEEGIRHNPRSTRLWRALGTRYLNPHSEPDYSKAAEAFRMASEGDAPLPFMRRFVAYAQVQDPEMVGSALPYVEELRHEPGGKVPTLVCVHFALLMRQDPARDGLSLATEMFDGEKDAYRKLGTYFLDLDANYPMNGVEETLRKLEKILAVPETKSVFTARAHLENRK
ncbi:hypothetical protein HNR46_003803 [Haloferula luteola]|uniref:DUF4034 domain-containing protein n=1 Tax=Haloferula luteola TaxID=595692 RepID=A0A840V6E2_9BACT|nr:hypothetical protein [Haloferula luteola]MBB5353542.1 hypothetical protein [Haloferula luteola]